jgi:hypothetical protein
MLTDKHLKNLVYQALEVDKNAADISSNGQPLVTTHSCGNIRAVKALRNSKSTIKTSLLPNNHHTTGGDFSEI